MKENGKQHGGHFWNTLRNSHSGALMGHQSFLPSILPARSMLNLSSRGPSYPLLISDTTYDSVRETTCRRNMHRAIMTAEPNAFRKCREDECPSSFLQQKQVVEDLLGDLHQEKDEKDWAILSGNKPHFSWSRLKSQNRLRAFTADARPGEGNSLSRKFADDYRSKGKDFLDPFNPFQQRTVGYTSGHVRSITEADTYGPMHSMHVEMKRTEGLVPRSPNTDRNRLLVTNEERKQFANSKSAKNIVAKSISATHLVSTKNKRFSSDVDARTKRNHWFDTFRQKMKSRKAAREKVNNRRMDATLSLKEKEEERQRIYDFECKLRASAKYR